MLIRVAVKRTRVRIPYPPPVEHLRVRTMIDHQFKSPPIAGDSLYVTLENKRGVFLVVNDFIPERELELRTVYAPTITSDSLKTFRVSYVQVRQVGRSITELLKQR